MTICASHVKIYVRYVPFNLGRWSWGVPLACVVTAAAAAVVATVTTAAAVVAIVTTAAAVMADVTTDVAVVTIVTTAVAVVAR